MLQAGDNLVADEKLTQVLKDHPEHYEALYQLGCSRLAQNDAG